MGFSRGYLTVCAALAIAVALPAGGFAAEPKGTLKLSCEEGKLLSLEARAVGGTPHQSAWRRYPPPSQVAPTLLRLARHTSNDRI